MCLQKNQTENYLVGKGYEYEVVGKLVGGLLK